jgi:hypothetical protein
MLFLAVVAGITAIADDAACNRLQQISYHTSTNPWRSARPVVVSNRLTLAPNTPEGIYYEAVPPSLATNTLYTLTLAYTCTTTSTPGRILIDLYRRDTWDIPEHDWIICPEQKRAGRSTNIFIFNSLTVPTGTVLRVLAPGYQSLAFYDFTFKPYHGEEQHVTSQCFNSQSRWDTFNTCTISNGYLCILPSEKTHFLARDLLRINPSNYYRIAITARTASEANADNRIHADLFAGSLFDHPETELIIAGIDLSRKWKTYSRSFNARNVPRTVSLRVFGSVYSPVEISRITFEPVSPLYYYLDRLHLLPSGSSLVSFLICVIIPAAVSGLFLLCLFQVVSCSRRTVIMAAGVLTVVFFLCAMGTDGFPVSGHLVLQAIEGLIFLGLTGWWLAVLILPANWRQYAILLALPAGFAVSTGGMCILCRFMHIPFPPAVLILIGLCILFDVILFFTSARKQLGITSESLLPLSTAALALLCLLGPMRVRPAAGLYSDCIDGLINCAGAEYVKHIPGTYAFDANSVWDWYKSCSFEPDFIRLEKVTDTVFLSRNCIQLIHGSRYRITLTARSLRRHWRNQLGVDLFVEGVSFPTNSQKILTGMALMSEWSDYSWEFDVTSPPPLVSLRVYGNMFSHIDIKRVTLEALDPPFNSVTRVLSHWAPRTEYPQTPQSVWYSGSTSYASLLLDMLNRTGTAYSLAVYSWILRSEAHGVFRLWHALVFGCIPVLVYLISRTLLLNRVPAAWTAAACCGVSPVLAYAMQNNSLAQSEGILLLLLAFACGFWALRILHRNTVQAFLCAAGCLVFLGILYLTYYKTLLYAAAFGSASAGVLLLHWLYAKNKWIAIGTALAVTACAVAGVYLFMTGKYHYIIKLYLGYSGDLKTMLSPLFLTGVGDYLSAVSSHTAGGRLPVMAPLFSSLLGIAVFGIAAAGLVCETRRHGWMIPAFTAILIIMYVLARFYLSNEYLIKKHLALCIPFFTLFIGSGTYILMKKKRPVRRVVVITVLSLLLASGIRAVWATGCYWAVKDWYFNQGRTISGILAPLMKERDIVYINTYNHDEQYLYMYRLWPNVEVGSIYPGRSTYAVVGEKAIIRHRSLWFADPEQYTLLYERNGLKILQRKK